MRFGIIILLGSLLSSLVSCSSQPEVANPQVPDDYFFRQRAYPSGKIDRSSYRKALSNHRQQLLARTQEQSWRFDGPTNIGGRITDIELIKGSPDVLLIGSASGGIWRSEDRGLSWDATFDQQASLAIGDLAVAPSNSSIIYAGTGEANAGGGSIAYDGMGVFKSTDGGIQWQPAGLVDVGSIGKIAVDPINPERVFVAAMGTLFADNDQRGIFRTENGGTTWEQVLFLSDSTGGIDVLIHPTHPDTIIAATWERVRRPNRRNYTGQTSSIYKSTDGGQTWNDVLQNVAGLTTDLGRISLAMAPSNPDRLYAGIVGNSGAISNMLRSDNGGDTWGNLSLSQLQTVSFDWWFNRLFVHPTDQDQLFYMGFNPQRYDAPSNRWTQIFRGVHVDQHALAIDPDNPNEMWLGNDGGLYFSEDGGIINRKIENLPITQFYTLGLDPNAPEQRFGGTQDNGTVKTERDSSSWFSISGGDGMTVRIDPTDDRFVYTSFQRGNVLRSTDRGSTFSDGSAGLSGSRRNWKTPFILDVDNPSTLYLGANAVFRSTNRALNWEQLSPDLTNGSQGSAGITYGTITALAQSQVESNILYAGTDDGNVWVSLDRALSWTNVTGAIPQRWVTDIATDPNDPLRAIVTVSGFRFGEREGHVWLTENAGQSWMDISQNLSDIPVNAVEIDSTFGYTYIATDIGVYWAADVQSSWESVGNNLPQVVVTDLAISQESPARLVASTYGRGIYSIPIAGPISNNGSITEHQHFSLYPNPAKSSGSVTVHYPISSTEPNIILIQDMAGKLLKTYPEHLEPRRTLYLNDLPPGQYVVTIVSGSGAQSSSQKLMVTP